jgi:hypothetical protein
MSSTASQLKPGDLVSIGVDIVYARLFPTSEGPARIDDYDTVDVIHQSDVGIVIGIVAATPFKELIALLLFGEKLGWRACDTFRMLA